VYFFSLKRKEAKMETIDAILTRRTIRRYTDEPVNKETENLLIKAAMSAPNAVGKRSWGFVVVRDKDQLQKVSDALTPHAVNVKNAPLVIVVCGDLNLIEKSMPELWVQDCSAAAENLLLAAHDQGLGGCWYSCYPFEYKVKNITEVLELPENIVPMCVISVGYPKEQKPDISDKKFETAKIHYDKW
jgi:nitroreductase